MDEWKGSAIFCNLAYDVVSDENSDFFVRIRLDFDAGCNRFVMWITRLRFGIKIAYLRFSISYTFQLYVHSQSTWAPMQRSESFNQLPPTYGDLVHKIESSLDTVKPNIRCLISKRVAEDLFSDFTIKTICAKHGSNDSSQLKGKFVNFDLRNGKLKLNLIYKTLQVVRLYRNYFLLLKALLPSGQKYNQRNKFHLFYGIPESLSSSIEGLRRVEDFLIRHFPPDSTFEEVYIVSNTEKQETNAGLKLRATNNCAIHLFRHSLRSHDKFIVFGRYTIRLILFQISLLFNPGAHVLANEHIDFELFSYPELINKISSLNLTQTLLLYPPTVFENSEYTNIPRNMWWYSANNIPFVSKNGEQTFFDRSFYRQSNINCNYVWSKGQIEFVSGITGVRSEDFGSLVFYLMEPPILTRSPNIFTLTIFDVTPFHLTGEDEFYSFSICSNFLLDTSKVVKELGKELNIEIRIQIKSKRERSKKHDERYFNLLQSLANDSSIVLIPEKVNLYNLIFNSDLIVSIPFTSPALIARELRVPSCYFSLNDRFNLPDFRDGIPTFDSAESLSVFIRKVLATYA